MKRFNIKYIVIGMTLLLSACTSSTHFAPVTDGWSNTQAASQTYRVQPEDTLYSIAFRYGLDYRQLADANHIAAPYHVVAGQTLVLLPQADDTLTTSAAPAGDTAPANAVVTSGAPSSAVSSQPINTTTTPSSTTSPTTPSTTIATSTQPAAIKPTSAVVPSGPVGQWLWPTQGKVIHTFSDVYGGNKGIDIAGSLGQPVRATAGGRVVYAGTGLRGYGLLIIIKHNNDYLSAYAHNSKAYVQEGDVVKSGQTIASMGSTDAPQNMLHFEIRKDGKPVDPLSYLPSKQG